MAEYNPHARDELLLVLQKRPRLEQDDTVLTVDLSSAPLAGLEVGMARLHGTSFVQANLDRSRWEGATLDGVKLRKASMRGATFDRAELDVPEGAPSQEAPVGAGPGCRIRRTDLNEVDLTDAQLAGVTFEGCHLMNARFERATLSDVTFRASDLFRADLRGARLMHCRFDAARAPVSMRRARLGGAVLIDCRFMEVDLSEADLSGALLVSCDLRGVNAPQAVFAGATLVGCNAEGINLDQAQLGRLAHAGTRFFHATARGARWE